jgi:hypothetical protein
MKKQYQKGIETYLPFLISLILLVTTCLGGTGDGMCVSSPDGDINGDCLVDYLDFQQMANEWLAGGDPNSDLDDDNDVDFNDFGILANQWQKDNSLPLVFHSDFEDANLDSWQATDPDAWRIEDGAAGNPGKVLSLFAASSYNPPFISPSNINLIKNVNVTSFVLELDMLSTTAYYSGRDLCLFFGYQDPSHFYYAHLADVSDSVHNTIHIVNNAPRNPIADYRNSGNSWEGEWHKVKLSRDADKGTIRVYFDDMNAPVMTADDTTFSWGKVGVGSFDDTGQFDNIQLWGRGLD